MEKEELKKVLQNNKLNLFINDYNYLFSDFDLRNFSLRTLSVDFLDEIKRIILDKKEKPVEVQIILPQKERNVKDEELIKERMRHYFLKHYNLAREDEKKTKIRGGLFLASGIIIMAIASWIIFSLGESRLIYTFFVTLLEPAGWFFFWEGLGILIFEPRERKKELEFYEVMYKARISFLGRKEEEETRKI